MVKAPLVNGPGQLLLASGQFTFRGDAPQGAGGIPAEVRCGGVNPSVSPDGEPPPFNKGGFSRSILMSYKHNPALTETARLLRKNMTKEERRLWYGFLKTFPLRFLRQKVIDSYIVDFYCAQANLVIELDGSQHFEEDGLLYDERRTEHLKKRGLKVIRIPNNEVNQNFEGVCQMIEKIVYERLS